MAYTTMTRKEKAGIVAQTRKASSIAYGVWQTSISDGEPIADIYDKRVVWEDARVALQDALDLQTI